MAETPPPFAQWLDNFKMSLGFLTRLPLKVDWDKGDLAQASRAFPLAGVIVGIIGGIAYFVGSEIGLPVLVCALLAVGAQILTTGGLHEDGLGDVADGFGGGATKEDKLRIMKDSAIGSYGVLALIIVVGLRVVCLGEIGKLDIIIPTLIGASALSRGTMPLVMAYLEQARSNGLAASAGKPSQSNSWIAGALGIAIALLFLGPSLGIAAVFGAALGTVIVATVATKQIGGYTGDVLGTVQQISEIGILLAVLANI